MPGSNNAIRTINRLMTLLKVSGPMPLTMRYTYIDAGGAFESNKPLA